MTIESKIKLILAIDRGVICPTQSILDTSVIVGCYTKGCSLHVYNCSGRLLLVKHNCEIKMATVGANVRKFLDNKPNIGISLSAIDLFCKTIDPRVGSVMYDVKTHTTYTIRDFPRIHTEPRTMTIRRGKSVVFNGTMYPTIASALRNNDISRYALTKRLNDKEDKTATFSSTSYVKSKQERLLKTYKKGYPLKETPCH